MTGKRIIILQLTVGFFIVSLRGVSLWETRGQSFMLILPSDGTIDAKTTISVSGNEGTSVEITAKAPDRTFQGSIDGSGVFNVTLGAEHHVNIPTETNNLKAIKLTTNLSVAVNILSTGSSFAASYTAIPDYSGSYFTHRVVTYCPENKFCNSVIAIVGMVNSLLILVTIKSSSVVTVNGVNYTDGQSLNVFVYEHGILLIRCKGDMTGTKVYSPFPTHVFSGSYCDAPGGDCDLTFEQMPAVRFWESKYSLTPLPRQVYGFYRIVGSTAATEVIVNNVTLATLQEEGAFVDINDIREMHNITASSPVQVAMLITAQSEPKNYSSAMIILQPSSENQKYYRVISPDIYTSYCQIEANSAFVETAWLNGQYLCDEGLYKVAENVSVVYIHIPHGGIHAICYDDTEYGLVVYGFRNRLGYGYAGISGKRNSPPREQCPIQTISAPNTYSLPPPSHSESILSLEAAEDIMSPTVIFEMSTQINPYPTNASHSVLPVQSSDHQTTENSLLQSLPPMASNQYDLTHVTNALGESNQLNATTMHYEESSDFNIPVELSADILTIKSVIESWPSSEDTSETIRHPFSSVAQGEVLPSSSSSSSLIFHFSLTSISQQQQTSNKLMPSPLISNTEIHGSVPSSHIVSALMSSLITTQDNYGYDSSRTHPEQSTPSLNLIDFDQDLSSMVITSSNMKQKECSSVTITKPDPVYSSSFIQTSTTPVIQTISIPSKVPQSLVTQSVTTFVPALCPCFSWMSSEEEIQRHLNHVLDALRKNLTLDKDTLSATIRKRISISDPRKSATGIGAFGTSIVAVLFSVVVIGDVSSLIRFMFGWWGKFVKAKRERSVH